MNGLYGELLNEPSNIFSSTPVAEGVIRLEPLQREFWLTCLQTLLHRPERLGLSSEQKTVKKPTAVFTWTRTLVQDQLGSNPSVSDCLTHTSTKSVITHLNLGRETLQKILQASALGVPA